MSPGADTPLAPARVLRAGPVSIMVRPRAVAVGVSLAVLCLLAAAVHLANGGTALPVDAVARALLGDDSNRLVYLAVTELRAPRTLAAIIAGACLAAAGALTQTVARNPLASPDILGVTAGSSLGAVSVVVLAGGGAAGLSGMAGNVSLPVAAFAGGVLAGALVYLLALSRSIDSYRLVLVGLGINGLAVSLTTWMLTLGDVTNAAQALTWMSGSLNGKDWPLVEPMAVLGAVLLAAALVLGRRSALLTLDDDVTTGLGVRVGLLRLAAFGLAALLASTGVVVAGPLVFVALASPQIARLITGSVTPPILPSALVGIVFVLIADTVAANALPVSLPAGVATAVLGGPYLIFLVLRYQRRLA
ncbi:ferric enterobactin transporter permease [Prauserella marina]|uniref:Iron complex transport system permease protein n=1 Tax=Prauserella marina TaxID=530584 RepID=A0A222VST4_9PSEU|nr:iron ABC transporter permease [Prauserella marina]ASR36986.1 ferric enterobactin transporter permease [Prauserella marina]PWV80045.1 iron complex transport system permease protein [Prauserella marina]SDD84415.1 iron complex transport system permease protein [Prauserella marina]